jgi:glycosyltransferase involved in cell wall biosynthesis
MSRLSFSVVCPTYQGEKNLPALFNCLENNFSKNTDAPELIFVIDNSSDNSHTLLEEFSNGHPDKKIEIHSNQKNLGPAESRNIGVELASGEIILFLDDDCRPNPHWYRDFSAAWNSAASQIQGIGGFVVPTELETFNGQYCSVFQPIRPWPLVPEKISFFQKLKNYYQTPNLATHGVAYLAGANMSFRRKAFLNIGGFSPSLRIAEDITICHGLREANGNDCLSVSEELLMPHEFTKSFKKTVHRSFAYGLGSGKNFWDRKGAFSINPGPGLILAFLFLFFIVSSIASNSLGHVLVYSFIFLILEILFYSLLVTQIKVKFSTSLPKRVKFGFAFLMCEMANTLGFISALRYVFRIRSQ